MAKVKKRTAAKQDVRYIYLGPTVLAAGLVQNRVYQSGIEEAFKLAAEKYPLVRQLVVPVSQLDAAKAAMRTKGTPQYLALQQIGGRK